MNITNIKKASVLAALLALAGVNAACGSDAEPLSEAAEVTPPVVSTDRPPAALDAAVKLSQTELGDVLANPTGMTLYGFTNDVDAESTCYGTCAEAWPPVIVSDDFIVSPGLDSGVFATTERNDGQLQLVAGKFPLYLYAADSKPGDAAGHGSGDVWFAIDPSGRLITSEAELSSSDTTAPAGSEAAPEASATLDVVDLEVGTILTDTAGLSLYLFTPDEAGAPTCIGGCAEAWPPLLVDGELVAAEGVDAALLSTVEHPDGGTQLKVGKWPVYGFAGDAAPGDTNGQGSGGNWFLIGADGKAVK